jgi:hypothetical protein
MILPTRPIGVLLREALGPDHIIDSTQHEMYRKLTSRSAL